VGVDGERGRVVSGRALRVRLLRLAVTSMLLVASAGPAAALRGVEPGSDCDRVTTLEEALGSKLESTLRSELAPGAVFVIFAGEYEGHPARLEYRCEGGVVLSQTIRLGLGGESEAHTAFSDAKRAMTALFGPPMVDADVPTIEDLDRDTEESASTVRRVATWSSSERFVSAMLSGHDASWELVLAVRDPR